MSRENEQPKRIVSPFEDINMIHKILELLPVRQAAQTCAVSKFWENIWSTLPHIDLGESFFTGSMVENNQDNRDIEEKEITLYQYSTAVCMVLASHVGPIWTFKLFIPPFLPLNFVHTWTKIVCRNGVEVLELNSATQFDFNPYITPFSVHDCSSLKTLVLQNFLLQPPPVPKPDRPKLESVTLTLTKIAGKVSLGDGLTYLCLENCTGVANLEHQFRAGNKLKHLHLHYNDQHDWKWLENCEELYELYLWLNQDCVVHGRSSANNVLGNMQKLHKLHINGFSFQFLDPTPTAFIRWTRIKILSLDSVKCYDLGEISKVLSLIRSSLNLKKLSITLLEPTKSTCSDELGRHYQELEDTSLAQLHTVIIDGVLGSPADLDLIKFLLASSPGLRSMSFLFHPNAEKLKIVSQVAKFDWASKPAAYSWLNSEAVRTEFFNKE